MSKLLLIDGNAMMHRAYHALPPLTNSDGQPVQAVYGFFSMLFNVLLDQKPTHLVVCFDRGAPTIRQSMYVGYHAHRPKMAEDFVPQVDIIHQLLERMKVAVFELDGYEGDDLIGTIATKSLERGFLSHVSDDARQSPNKLSNKSRSLNENRLNDNSKVKKNSESVFNSSESGQETSLEVIILTGDRDMLQLVNHKVKVLMPLVGISKTALFDEKAVEEKYGVKSSQFIDYKALIGDASDGYPGVTGIGPKTAASLLQKYGTFENLYKKVGELPEKVGLKLATDAEQAALAKKLATIMIDVPIQFDIAKCNVTDFDIRNLREGFREQGFKTLTARIDIVFGKEEEQLGLL